MTIFPVFKKYETGAKELFSECTNLPEEFKDKWNSYFTTDYIDYHGK